MRLYKLGMATSREVIESVTASVFKMYSDKVKFVVLDMFGDISAEI